MSRRPNWLTAAAVCVGAPVAGIAVAASPAVGVVLLMAPVLVVSFFAPRLLAAGAFAAILLSRPLQFATGVDTLGLLDEAAVALVTVVLPLHRMLGHKRLRFPPGIGWFSAFAALGFASSLIVEAPVSVTAQGGFLVLKGVLFYFAVAQLDITTDHLRRLARALAWVVAACLAAAVANLLAPTQWAATFSNVGVPDFARGPTASLIGPFSHPGEFGPIMALSAVALLGWRQLVGRSISNTALLLGCSVAALGTYRRKTVISLAAGALYVRWRVHRGQTVLLLIFAVPLLLAVAWDLLEDVWNYTALEYFTNNERVARVVLTRESFDVASDHFPFGAGFGRYGSYMAGVEYSPEYAARGFRNIYGLSNRAGVGGDFLTDTSWPAAIGETGYLGTAAFVVALFVIYRWARRTSKGTSDPLIRWLGIVVVGWLIIMLIESSGTPVFSTAPIFGPFFGAAGLLAALTMTAAESEQRAEAERAVPSKRR